MSDSFILFVDPVPKGRPRMTRSGHTYTPQKTKDAEKEIQRALLALAAKRDHWPYHGPLHLEITYTIKTPKTKQNRIGSYHEQRPDIDNFEKLVLDSLNEIVYVDDGQVAKVTHEKVWGEHGSIAIKITQLKGRKNAD